MLNFLRNFRKKVLAERTYSKYLLYAIGEIALVVIGILIALRINGWNDHRRMLQKEIEMLQAFDLQFTNDVKQFDECLAFHAESEHSIDLLIRHLDDNLPYHDSLSRHFFASTRIYIDADMANHVFETLQSIGVDLISNEEIRNNVVLLYEDEDQWIKNFETMYIDFVLNASKELFPTRFRDFWQGDYTDLRYLNGSMTPLDFDQLKQDQEYLYFIRTQKNFLGWLIKRPLEETRSKLIALQGDIRREVRQLKSR